MHAQVKLLLTSYQAAKALQVLAACLVGTGVLSLKPAQAVAAAGAAAAAAGGASSAGPLLLGVPSPSTWAVGWHLWSLASSLAHLTVPLVS